MTGPGRYTVTLEDGGHLHLNPNQQPESYTDLERRTISQAYRDFVRYVMDWKYVTLESRAVIGHVQQVCKNVMMVPCFAAPLWDDSRSTPGFNLFEVSRRELQYYFPSTPTRTVLENHDDLRPAHLTDENNRMLACLINEHLGPGLFDPGYGEFDTAPKQPFDQCFRKKK